MASSETFKKTPKTDDEWLLQMEKDDDDFRERYEKKAEEEKEIFTIDPTNLSNEFIKSIGTMQRFSDELTKLKFKRQKVKRLLDKLYNDKYEELKMGRLNVKLNSKTEYDIYISKSAKYQRVKSYYEILEILIEHIERTIKNLSQKIFVIQSMVKDRDRDMGQY